MGRLKRGKISCKQVIDLDCISLFLVVKQLTSLLKEYGPDSLVFDDGGYNYSEHVVEYYRDETDKELKSRQKKHDRDKEVKRANKEKREKKEYEQYLKLSKKFNKRDENHEV